MSKLSDQLLTEEVAEELRRHRDEENREIGHLARTIKDDISLHDMEQMMKRDLIMNITADDFDEKDSMLLEQYMTMAHGTWSSDSGSFRVDPFLDVARIWESAMEWANKQMNGSFQVMECDMGRRRRFISEHAAGLDSALSALGLRIRYDVRGQQPQVLNQKGIWVNINDRIESFIRDRIASLFSFIRIVKSADKPKAVDASWSNSQWKIVFDTYLGENEVDAFHEWLTMLPQWDGIPRLNTWLEDCGMVPEPVEGIEELMEWASKSILLCACVRTIKPGEKHDTIPVLVGEQGIAKSSAQAWLIPKEYRDEWFTDTLKLSSGEKARVESILGKVIVEISEMSGATTSEIESIRSFLSRTNDHMRLSYRKNPEGNPRLCSMVGTANGTSVLPNDPAGNRRFVAIRLQSGDVATAKKYLNKNRKQLWAEAWKRAKDGEPAWFPNHLSQAQSELNELSRAADTVIEDAVSQWLDFKRGNGVLQFEFEELCIGAHLLKQDESVRTMPRPMLQRINRVLERYGCKRKRVMDGGERKFVWMTLPE